MSETIHRKEYAIGDRQLTGGTGLAAEVDSYPYALQCSAQECKLRGIDMKVSYGVGAVTITAEPRDDAHQPASHCVRERMQLYCF